MARWLSLPRFDRYLRASGNDADRAVSLYEWNANLASAVFEAIHYVEIAVRNAIDNALRDHFQETLTGIPWFLGQSELAQRSATQIEVVRRRLADENKKETRDQIIAGLSFGFWRQIVGKPYTQLWIEATRHAFPNSKGDIRDIRTAFAWIHPFRNRVAHHEPIFNKDVSQQLDIMLDLMSWLDPPADAWLERVQRVRQILNERPVPRLDTVVVAGKDAWPFYQSHSAYVCQAGRSFQPVDHIAFYSDKAVQPDVPRIRRRVDNVPWTDQAAAHLEKSSDPDDLRLASVIRASRAAGWTEGRYQLFELSHHGDPDHTRLRQPIPHTETGRGKAFTQNQRYTLLDRMKTAKTTANL